MALFLQCQEYLVFVLITSLASWLC